MRELKQVYTDLANLTLEECKNCSRPYSCCSKDYCEFTLSYAKEEYGISLPLTTNKSLPLMGLNGCTVEPYLRPLCTLHTCEIYAYGEKISNAQWTKKYFHLREKINKLEFQRKEKL